MRHHAHPGPVGRPGPEGADFTPHPSTVRDDAHPVWFALPDAAGRDVGSLEAMLCVPSREGTAQLLAVPHLAVGLTFGDEVAIGDWKGEPMARGLVASALRGTVRVVLADSSGWDTLARAIDELATPTDEPCWFDVIGEHAVAVSVPRSSLAVVFALLDERAATGVLRWEYATPERHA